ncbi:hypothetical protein PG913_11365 [Tenacibaculum pacificus]|uniref:hypothetical protein n=1 Tax=Tenacibaculum TaxID=104267 RepID=UPI0022F3935A|nr:hypothetical protein [Tenacibaculum pacificus]WBX73427.1 hypothetical protein PG913_11365 [Tenacibaculum pacificus]
MVTNIDVLKDSLYEKIEGINDEKVLKAIITLVDSIKTDILQDAVTEKRDLTSYIKEWAKDI